MKRYYYYYYYYYNYYFYFIYFIIYFIIIFFILFFFGGGLLLLVVVVVVVGGGVVVDDNNVVVVLFWKQQVLREHIDPFALSLDTMYARQKGFYDFQFNERLLTCVKSVVGGEITLNPIQHCRYAANTTPNCEDPQPNFSFPSPFCHFLLHILTKFISLL